MEYQWAYKAKQCTRNGVMLNRGQFFILAKLITAKERGFPWVDLQGEQKRNLTNMQRNDWIVKSKGMDGVKYSITGRGEALLKDFAVRKHRTDGKCARCGKNDRHKDRSSYCKKCEGDISKERYYRLIAMGKDRMLDTSCKYCDKPRHKTSNGRIFYALCDDHLKVYLKDKASKYRQSRYKKGAEDRRCFCGNPVHVTNKDIHYLCTEHYKTYLQKRTILYKARKFSRVLKSANVNNHYFTK